MHFLEDAASKTQTRKAPRLSSSFAVRAAEAPWPELAARWGGQAPGQAVLRNGDAAQLPR